MDRFGHVHADWYRDLWARREALNAAAFARVPGLAQAVAAETAQLGR
jgi:hypothetical protein